MHPHAPLAAFYFTYFCYLGAYVAYFTLWLADLGFSAAQIASVLAAPQLVRIFAPAGWGWLADRTGARRRIVIVSSACVAASFAGLLWSHEFVWVLATVALMSVFSAGVLPLVEATTMTVLAGRTERYGAVRVWGSVGFIASVLALGAALDALPVSIVMHAILALMALAAAAAFWLPDARGVANAAEGEGLLKVLARPGVAAFFGASLCMSAAHGTLYAFYSIYLVEAGYSKTLVGLLWTLGVTAEIVLFLRMPWILARASLRAVLLASLLAACVRFVAIGWGVGSLAVLAVAQLLHAATFGAYHAAAVAAVHRFFPGHLQARGQALYSSISYGVGGMTGVLLAGWTWEALGAQPSFALSALFGLAGTGLVAWRVRV